MFYEQVLLSQKGAFANLWIAAHWTKKLTKAQVSQIVGTNIPEAAGTIDFGAKMHKDKISEHNRKLALRLRGHLLLGLCRIYYKKVDFLYSDCSNVLIKIKMAFRPATNIDLDASVAAVNQITLGENIEEYELEMPDVQLDFDNLPESEDNLLSLHALRSKVLITRHQEAAAALTPSTSLSGGFNLDMDEGLFGENLEVEDDFLEQMRAAKRRESVVDDDRMLVDEDKDDVDEFGVRAWKPRESGTAQELGPADDAGGWEYSYGNDDDGRAYVADPTEYELGIGRRESRAASIAASVASIEDLPAPAARVRRNYHQLMDEDTQLDHNFLRERITNPDFYAQDEFALAPLNKQEMRKRKLLALSDGEFYVAPVLKNTPWYLRSLMRHALSPQVVAGAPVVAADVRGGDVTPLDDTMRAQEPMATPGGKDYAEMFADYGAGDDDRGYVADEPGRMSMGAGEQGERVDFDAPEIAPPVGLSVERSREEELSIPIAGDIIATGEEEAPKLYVPGPAEPLSVNASNHYKLFKKEAGDADSFGFGTMIAPRAGFELNKLQVARSFLAMLEMKTKDYIDIEQEEPFGDINVSFIPNRIPPGVEVILKKYLTQSPFFL